MVPLYTRLLPPMRRNHIHLGRLRSDQAHPRRLIPIHAAPARTQVAFAEMRIRQRSFLRSLDGGEQLVTREVFV